MSNITGNQWMQIIGLPILFVVVGILAKKLAKRDGDESPKINDWAVCTSVVLMTFGKIASDMAEFFNNTVHTKSGAFTFWWLMAVFIFIFISLEHDRFRSWRLENDGSISKHKHIWFGVIIPNFTGVIVFASYQLSKFL